jgi:REP element-mobilizing transposase RayT
MSHLARTPHDARCPAHVTLRAAAGLASLRSERLFPAVRAALVAATSERFRVLQFSVQRDHLHLLVEASSPTGFERGVRGLAIRVARAVNRALARRGAVWGDRYHSHVLHTPREVRNALVYVLNNWRKHEPSARGLDPRSSAAWFDGWREPAQKQRASSPIARATTWLASIGWRMRGLLGVDERPRGAP